LAKKAKGSKRKENGKHSGSERPSKRAKKTNGNEGAEEEDEDEEEEDSPWICCDACGEWVLAKDDNIEDVSMMTPTQIIWIISVPNADTKLPKPK